MLVIKEGLIMKYLNHYKMDNKSKRVSIILSGVIVFFILLMTFLVIKKIDQMSFLKEEAEYWGRTYSLLGKDWSILLNGNSLVNYGYSIFILPICILIDDGIKAYKIALFINGIMLCVSYFISFGMMKKIFKNEKERFCIFVSFLITMSPVFIMGRFTSGPEIMLLAILWLIIYIMADIVQHYSLKKVIILELLLFCSVALHIAMIGVCIAVIFFFLQLLKYNKIELNKFIGIVTFIVFGLIINNFIDQIFVNYIFKDSNLIYWTSFGVFVNGLITGWNENSIINILFSVLGKIFSLSVSTFLLIIPGIHFLIKHCFKKKAVFAKDKDVQIIYLGIFFVFLIPLILVSVFYLSLDASQSITNIRFLQIFAAPLVLCGIMQIKNTQYKLRELLICTVSIFILALGTGFMLPDIIEKEYMGAENGLLFLGLSELGVKGLLPFIVMVAVFVISIILYALVKNDFINKKLNSMLKVIGMCGITLVFVFSGIILLRSSVFEFIQLNTQELTEISELIEQTDTSGKVFYLSQKPSEHIEYSAEDILPSVFISGIKDRFFYLTDDDTEYERVINNVEPNSYIITPSASGIIEKMSDETDYYLVDIRNKYALWINKDSKNRAVIKDVLSKRIETISNKPLNSDDTDGEQGDNDMPIYGQDVKLSPGTYEVAVTLKYMDMSDADIASLIISDSSTELDRIDFNKSIFTGNHVKLGITLASEYVINNFNIKLSLPEGVNLKVEEIIYRKADLKYTVGKDNKDSEDSILTICNLIKEFDTSLGSVGKIQFLKNVEKNDPDISLSYIKEILVNYEVTDENNVNDIQGEYVLCFGDDRAYFSLMDQYSILFLDDNYCLLVKNDSRQYEAASLGLPFILSKGKNIDIRAFLQSVQGQYVYNNPITLLGGNYNYIFDLTLEEGINDNGEIGDLIVKSGSNVIGTMDIFTEDFDSLGKLQISIPIALHSKKNEVTYELKMNKGVVINAKPSSIELVSENFKIGSDNPDGFEKFAEIANIANSNNEKFSVNYQMKKSDLESKFYDFSYLKSLMPKADIHSVSYSDSYDNHNDNYLITYGFTSNYFRLVKYYTIIGIEGKYTFWASSKGELVQDSVLAGAKPLSNGSKIAPETLAKIQGKKFENNLINNLKEGKYKLYIKLEQSNLESDDKIEYNLNYRYTKKDIKAEKDDLLKLGYTKEMASNAVKTNSSNVILVEKTNVFDGHDSIIKTIEFELDRTIEALQLDVSTWKNGGVSSSICWIEMR